MSSKQLNVGIIGLGHLHPRLYMPLFANCPDTKVVAVSEKNEQLLNSFCQDFQVKGYNDYQAMIKEQKLDMAVIFLPHCDCGDAAVKCAAKGINIIVEKPVAHTAKEASRIAKAVAKYGVKFSTGYCWRLHPAAVQIKRLIEEGVLGDIVGGEARIAAGRIERYITGNSPWMLEKAKSGGGPMYNLGVHWIDLLRYMLNDDVKALVGRNVKINKKYDIEDNSFAHLQFGKGMIIGLDVSYTVPDSFPFGRDLYIGLRGTKGTLSWAPAYEGSKDVVFVCSDAQSFSGAAKREFVFELDKVAGYSGYMGQAYINDFARAIIKNGKPYINVEDTVKVLNIVEAIYESDRQGRWVKV